MKLISKICWWKEGYLMQELMKKTTLILIGLAMIIGATLVSPALHEIGLAYPDADPALLPLLVTLPSLTLLLGLVVSSVLSSKVAAKPLILLGLLLILVSGIGPAFLSNLTLIIVLRGVLGVGLGMIMPLQMTLFAQYPERERAALIGCNSAVNCVIGVFFIALAGKLAMLDWHLIFYLYIIFLPILLAAVIFIPYQQPSAQEAAKPSGKGFKLPKEIFIYCGFVAVGMVTFYVILTNMAFYLNDYQLGDAAVVGMLTAAGTAGSALGAFLMPWLERLLKQYAAPITMAVMAVGFMLLLQTNTVVTVGAGYVLQSFCQGVFGCLITFKFTQMVALEQVSQATSCYMGTVYGSQFLAPYLMLALQKLPGLGTMRSVFAVYAVVMVVMSVLFLLAVRREGRPQSG